MVTAAEGATAKQGIAANLAGGVNTLSGNDTVTFTQYVRLVLPLDGFVFWVKADLITPGALLNAMSMNNTVFNAHPKLVKPATTLTVQGSLHYATRQEQNEDETPGVSTVTFTSLEQVQEFNDVAPNTLWIGEYAGDVEMIDGPIIFAFSSRGNYYQRADLYHYRGTAVLPVFKASLIDTPEKLAAKEMIVSNSLPLWLSLNHYLPPYPGWSTNLELFPSFLVPDNLPPPYGAVHVDPAGTQALQAAPWIGPTSSQYALTRDLVRVTLYGSTNELALRFLNTVLQYSYDYNTLGIMNMPSVRDGKRTAPELNLVAMQKFIDFEVSYTQQAMRNIARQYIEKVIVNYRPIVPPVPIPNSGA